MLNSREKFWIGSRGLFGVPKPIDWPAADSIRLGTQNFIDVSVERKVTVSLGSISEVEGHDEVSRATGKGPVVVMMKPMRV